MRCRDCDHYAACSTAGDLRYRRRHCEIAAQKKVPTNYDRFQRLNAEKLAEFLESIGYCPPIHNKREQCVKHKNEPCSACWLDWLQSPADGGDGDAVQGP